MFDTAISGLQAATTDLSVIGNNVANASSTGFKSSRAQFADVYAASSSPSNAVGLGVKTAGINQMFTQGTLNLTNNNLDLAIDGQGFFGLADGGSMVYTRAGAFGTDKDGYIVNNAGQRLTGYQGDGSGAVSSQRGELRIDASSLQPAVTSRASASLNLEAGSTEPATTTFSAGDSTSYNRSTSLSIYDSLGNSHDLSLYFVNAGGGLWDVHALVDGVTVGGTPAQTIQFGTDGLLDPATTPINIADWHPLDPGGAANGATDPSPAFDISLADSTQFGSPFSVYALSQDGYAAGQLSRIGIDESGTITSYYSNGKSQALGQVALYNFANPQGLQQLGDTTWSETPSSGPAMVGAPGTGSLGGVQSGALEQSNVDLTAELVHLILAQRNYQANAQTIQAADAVTQTIINIR